MQEKYEGSDENKGHACRYLSSVTGSGLTASRWTHWDYRLCNQPSNAIHMPWHGTAALQFRSTFLYQTHSHTTLLSISIQMLLSGQK